jgi:vacuolar-type H+-ATPase subunit E/Vma4
MDAQGPGQTENWIKLLGKPTRYEGIVSGDGQAMKSVEESTRALSRAASAKAKADAIRQHAQDQSEAERDEILKHARQKASRIHSQAVAAAQLKARTLRLERREKLLNSIFDAARKQFLTVQERADYDQIARQLTREAVVRLGAEKARILADERTQALLTDDVLSKVSEETGVQLQLGEPLERGTGVISETMDGHRNYDNTLEARLERWQNALRSPVYHLLMEESL